MDTSVWVDHLRSSNAKLGRALQRGKVLGHPWVTGELSLGYLDRQEEIIGLLHRLPQAIVAAPDEIETVIERQQLPGSGIGYVDAQLLTATMLTPDSVLWTADRRLQEAAANAGLEFAIEI